MQVNLHTLQEHLERQGKDSDEVTIPRTILESLVTEIICLHHELKVHREIEERALATFELIKTLPLSYLPKDIGRS